MKITVRGAWVSTPGQAVDAVPTQGVIQNKGMYNQMGRGGRGDFKLVFFLYEVHGGANEDHDSRCVDLDAMKRGWCRSHTGRDPKQRKYIKNGGLVNVV